MKRKISELLTILFPQHSFCIRMRGDSISAITKGDNRMIGGMITNILYENDQLYNVVRAAYLSAKSLRKIDKDIDNMIKSN